MGKRATIIAAGGKDQTLDRYLVPLQKFGITPSEKFGRYYFGEFNGEKLYYFAVYGEMCFTLANFAQYVGIPYDTVKKAFSRQCKRDLDGFPYLVEGKDFFKLERNMRPDSGDKLSPKTTSAGAIPREERSNPEGWGNSGEDLGLERRGNAAVFLTFMGVWKLLPTFRGDLPLRLYLWFGERAYAQMKEGHVKQKKDEDAIIKLLGYYDRYYPNLGSGSPE